MLIGFTVEPYKKWSPANIVTGLQSLGIRFVELNQRAFADAEKLGRSLRGMTSAFHLPIVEEEGWDFSLEDHLESIEGTIALLKRHGHAFRIRHLVCHPPEPMRLSAEPHPREEFLFSNLSKLDLPVHFENVETGNPSSYKAFLHRAKQALGGRCAGMCFDAAHFFIKGYNPVYEFIAFRSQIGAIHLSDCRPGKDLHMPFACGGQLPIDDLLRQIRSSRFNGAITLEMIPHTTAQIVPYIQSYLRTLRALQYRNYLIAVIRFWAFRRLLKSFSK